MDKEEIIEFLKQELDIAVVPKSAQYGDGSWIEIELSLNGEVIASDTLYT